MRQYLEKLPKEIRGLIQLIGDAACEDNVRAYLVGGFVRDLILGVKNLDLDIVVEGDGIKFATFLAGILKAKLTTHKRFGTASILIDKSFKIDISSARKECYPQPGHLPVVLSGTLKDDLFRRDFSINAMAVSLACDDFGKLIDLFCGEDDLRNKRIRVLHNLSFKDDPTRILRAVRFETRYEFKIEPQTLKYLKEAVGLKLLEKVEPQRIRDDLILILKEKTVLKEIKRLHKLIGFSFITAGLRLDKRHLRFLEMAQKEIFWFKEEYPIRRHIQPWLVYFTCLISHLSVSDIKIVCRRLALRAGEERIILTFKQIRPGFVSRLNKKLVKPSVVFHLLEPLSYEAIILLKAKIRNRYLHKKIEEFLLHYNGMRTHITGHDLNSLGIAPGPEYQKILGKVLDGRLDGLVKTKEEELTLVKRIIRKHPNLSDGSVSTICGKELNYGKDR